MTTITTSHKREHQSSVIDDVHYDYDKKVLTVTFLSGGNKYRYKNISEELFDQIRSAESLGGFLIMNIFTNPKHQKFEIVK